MRIRVMEERDVPRVVTAWNRSLKHDPMTEERFHRIVFGDPNYEPEGVVIAEGREDVLLGFAAAVLRRTVAGADGGGDEWRFTRGFLKAFFIVYGEVAWSAGSKLLETAERYCAQACKQEMLVTTYTGRYFWPGIDLRYERLRDILLRQGYRDTETIEDVGINLQAEIVPMMYNRVCQQLPSEVSVVRWEPSLLPKMRAFVTEGNMPQWFPVGWENGLSEPRDTVFILQNREEILGWAQYWPGVPRAGFGPILVLPRARGNNYGARLLLECMLRSREAGCSEMTADWANTGFYTRHGWNIIRRYSVLVKELV